MATVYRGFSFPFRIEGNQFPAEATDDELIAESLEQLIMVGRDERIMREGGSNVLSYVFETNDALLAENLRTEISNLVARFEPRVILYKVLVGRKDSAVLVDLHYVVRATRQEKTLSLNLAVG